LPIRPSCSAAPRNSFPKAERTRRERDRQFGAGIVDYATEEAARLMAFALSGELWIVAVAEGRTQRLPAAGAVVDPEPGIYAQPRSQIPIS
jgi:dipeptidyl-peptidase 4